MIDKERQRWLEWFLDIINFDYKAASRKERFEITAKLMFTLAGYSKLGISRSDAVSPEELWKATAKSDSFPTITTEQLVSSLQELFLEVMEKSDYAKGTNRIGDPSYPISTFNEIPVSIRLVTVETDFGPTYRTVLEGMEEKDSLRFHFLQLLDGVPLNLFRKCPECHTWFIHVSKRERIYCSTRCAARNATRKSRERLKKNDPERYSEMLRKGAERARRSYESRVRKNLGNVRIASSPRKHKEKFLDKDK